MAHRTKNITNTTLEDALAQDQMRRQQEQSIRVPSNEYQHLLKIVDFSASSLFF
ncbi:hypothetical protein [Nostoc sp. FACHB-888]|uniref:hypothetical protein n=1 Tax=Nostoc sp. FACHB-888 TaxID=2692842 RepID=UPI0016822A27|nr:hypothetical protein [Nostoc sp. FACHB-888]MBD2247294.1 hypothetical protein [Nostoc sp. FACHB-888]